MPANHGRCEANFNHTLIGGCEQDGLVYVAVYTLLVPSEFSVLSYLVLGFRLARLRVTSSALQSLQPADKPFW